MTTSLEIRSHIAALDEYRRLAWEYQGAMTDWSLYPFHRSWERMKSAIRDLNRQNEIIELNRKVL